MDKRYQVFVSSTYEDLKEERKEVMQILLELHCIPLGMELFPATDDDQWTLIKRVIDDCDYYVVIIAGRYGSLNKDGVSFTEMEYDYAIRIGKPVIGFIIEDVGKIISDKSESDPGKLKKLGLFVKKVEQKVCKKWNSSADLGSKILRSIVKLKKEKPGIGWVRANQLKDETSAKEILELKNTLENLESELNQLSHKGPQNIDDLAQGNDQIEVRYKADIDNLDDGDTYQVDFKLKTTWNMIFSAIGPSMRATVESHNLSNKFGDFINSIRNSHIENIVKRQFVDFKILGLVVNTNDFETILSQFKTLGYIDYTVEAASLIGFENKTNWQLTPYGENELGRIKAIKRK